MWIPNVSTSDMIFIPSLKIIHESVELKLLGVWQEYCGAVSLWGKLNKKCVKANTYIPAHTRVYPEVSGLASWNKNCKLYSSLPLGAVVWLFCWVSPVSFAAMTLYVASQQVFIVVVVIYFVMTQSGNFWIHLRIHISEPSNSFSYRESKYRKKILLCQYQTFTTSR
jgi:hypothetical protein